MLEGLDELLQRQHLQMRTEESQQLRQFRGRLAEIEAQLAAYRQAAAASQDDWMGKTVSTPGKALQPWLSVLRYHGGWYAGACRVATESSMISLHFGPSSNTLLQMLQQKCADQARSTRSPLPLLVLSCPGSTA